MNLEHKINIIRKFFDIDKIINKSTTPEDISRYYRVNKLAYWLFHSKEGFVHVGITREDKFKKEDLLEPLKKVEEYIRKSKSSQKVKVLELATGKGANINYLAQVFPEVDFFGLDLPSGQVDLAKIAAASLNNFQVIEGDFHDLSQFEDQSVDLVFIIESLCYSDYKSVVAKEVSRVLKKEGYFIIVDGYSGPSKETLTVTEILTKKLVEKGMLVNNLEPYSKVKREVLNEGFDLVEEEDVSKLVIPTVKRFEKSADLFFKLGFLAKLIIKVLPDEFTHNVVSGFLLPDVLESGYGVYFISVFRKK